MAGLEAETEDAAVTAWVDIQNMLSDFLECFSEVHIAALSYSLPAMS